MPGHTEAPKIGIPDPIYAAFGDALDAYTGAALHRMDGSVTPEQLEIAASDLVHTVAEEFARLRRMQMLGALAVAILAQGPLEAKLCGSLIKAELDKAKADGSLTTPKVPV